MGEQKTCTKKTVFSSPERKARKAARTAVNKARRKAKHLKKFPNDLQAANGQTAEPFSRKHRLAEYAKRLAEHMARKGRKSAA